MDAPLPGGALTLRVVPLGDRLLKPEKNSGPATVPCSSGGRSLAIAVDALLRYDQSCGVRPTLSALTAANARSEFPKRATCAIAGRWRAMARCPICSKEISQQHGMRTHLIGKRARGGHEMPEMDADTLTAQVFSGGHQVTLPVLPKALSFPTHSPDLLSNPYASFIIRLFEMLTAQKRVPKYQFKRRIDGIISLFLPSIFRAVKGWNVDLVVPEFPLKKAPNNLSANADHLLFRHADGSGTTEAWLLFELKTDDGSFNEEQLNLYLSALNRGMPQLLAELELISTASGAFAKYAEMRSRCDCFPADRPVELVYLSPTRHAGGHRFEPCIAHQL